MRKSTISKIRQKIAAILIVLMSIESFAAVVSDNDGAAFITKAEFDSLKNTFQSQLNVFNSQIDDKIDGVINEYLSGIRSKRTSRPTALLNNLAEERRTFTNSWNNPTTSTQANMYLQIAKNVIGIYSTGQFRGFAAGDPTITCYALNTLSGNHAKWRAPKNNGGTGRYLTTKLYNDKAGKYYIEDVGLYDVDEILEINGGQASDNAMSGYNWFVPYMDASVDWTNRRTDSIWTANFKIAEIYKVKTLSTTGAPDTTNYTYTSRGLGDALGVPPAAAILDTYVWSIPAFCSICVMETNVGNQNFLKTMSSGAVWTANTGTIQEKHMHEEWTYKYENIVLAGAGAQALGGVFYWDPTATNPNTSANTGWRIRKGLNVANNYNNENEPISFYGPQVDMVKGTDFIVKDVSDLVSKELHYYSGLPLFKLNYKGKLTLNLEFKWTNKSNTIVAIRNEPFDNTAITSRSTKDIFWKNYSTSDLSTGKVKIEIPANDLTNSVNKTLYIKVRNNNTTNGSQVVLNVGECILEEV